MTEKPGGSDLSNTETIARVMQEQRNDKGEPFYALRGFKWFTSAIDSSVTVLLAKVADKQQQEAGEAKEKIDSHLSCFVMRIRNDTIPKDKQNNLNGIKIHKLKNKLGTKALPTAELSLRDAKAEMIGVRGRGVATISPLLNITRVYNTVSACGMLRRMVALCQDYARKRRAQGKLLSNTPLHLHSLAKLVVEQNACLHLATWILHLLGKSECGIATAEEANLLRLFTPIAKLYTAKKAVMGISEGMELIGGMGYMEDSKVPRLLRNAQVLPIWEGTTNILSLDVLRVFTKSPAVLSQWIKYVQRTVAAVQKQLANHAAADATHKTVIIPEIVSSITAALDAIAKHVAKHGALQNKTAMETGARELAFALAHTQVLTLLFEFAQLKLVHNEKNNTNSTTVATALNKDLQIAYQYLLDHTPLVSLVDPLATSNDLVKTVLHREKLIALDEGGYHSALRSKY